jgi:ornithine--oxo-acid transaminase
MAPIATPTSANTNPTTLKATAPSFHPSGTPDPSKYHASSSDEAISAEAKYAAHNYHPLPVVFARASGSRVWDPENKEYLDFVRYLQDPKSWMMLTHL